MNDHCENKLITERREKLSKIRKQGIAYPNTARPTDLAADLHQVHDHKDKPQIESEEVRVSIAGRMMAQRIMGKASFASIQDRSGRIQLYVQRDTLAEGLYAQFKGWDLGDIVSASGTLMKTNKGELSIAVDSIELVSKSLRPLPEKFHGLTDQEIRYRQRYVDLIMNEGSRQVFLTRSRIVRLIRDFLEAPGREFLEVETPMMHYIPGGAAARPFTTHHNALDVELYLRVAPELYLKRLVVGGFERVYEINRNFRNEGVSARHNPEFTMLEFYQAYASYTDLMDLTELMLREIAEAVIGQTSIEYQGLQIDFGKPFDRVTLTDAVRATNPTLSESDCRNREVLCAAASTLKIPVKDSWGWGKLLLEIYEVTVESTLVNPTFITAYPAEVSPLSRRNDQDPELTDRFELIIAGREIANGFSELNDPEDQQSRFEAQVAEKDAGDEEAMAFDADYIRALEYGMPPAAGEGIGIDRLVMLFTDSASIRDVLLFPYMRPESG